MPINTMFSHPLARKARVWRLGGTKGGILTVLTKLELNSKKKKFDKAMVKQLSDSAKEWLSFNQDKASDFVLMNRPKDW